jgi:very-short-patch-repair endonuclease
MAITSMFYGASPIVFEKAKQLRNNMTGTEKALWLHLANNRLNGFAFRSQHPIFIFIVDFYCHKARLVVELDGGYHLDNDQFVYDNSRTLELKRFGLRILRFSNEEVEKDIEAVIRRIKIHLDEPLAH